MLVIGRHLNESVVLSGGVRITVVHVGKNKIKLGFEAPPEVSIVREELISDEDLIRGRTPDPRVLDRARDQMRRPDPEQGGRRA